MFNATVGLFAGWILFIILGGGGQNESLLGLAVLCLLASIITMYVDLRDLDKQLWDTSPILWAIGAALLYIVVTPLYIYKRRQVG